MCEPISWGYSFPDRMDACSYSLALLGARYHRERTGQGQWIDAASDRARHESSPLV